MEPTGSSAQPSALKSGWLVLASDRACLSYRSDFEMSLRPAILDLWVAFHVERIENQMQVSGQVLCSTWNLK